MLQLLQDGHADVLRESVAWMAEQLMEAQVAGQIGAELGERTPDRVTHGNGYRPARVGHPGRQHRAGDPQAAPHWGEDAALEKHYVARRSQRTRSVLTFFAHDTNTHNLVYANADLHKATQAREVLVFCDHWHKLTGAQPATLVFDQRLTTQDVLAQLDRRSVRFITLRMRSPALLRHIAALDPAAWGTVTLDRDGDYRKPQVVDEQATPSAYPGTVRQLVVRGSATTRPP